MKQETQGNLVLVYGCLNEFTKERKGMKKKLMVERSSLVFMMSNFQTLMSKVCITNEKYGLPSEYVFLFFPPLNIFKARVNLFVWKKVWVEVFASLEGD